MLLTDTLPQHAEVAGRKHRINTDFRVWIAFETAVQNGSGELDSLLPIVFQDEIPHPIEDAAQAMEWFYCCGSVPNPTKPPTNTKQAYSFETDGTAVFADFWRYYHLDLSQAGLHWWVFRALLEGLSEKSEFKQRVYYRTCDLKGLSKKERERILGIRARIALKHRENGNMTLEERNARMKAYLAKRRADTKGGGS